MVQQGNMIVRIQAVRQTVQPHVAAVKTLQQKKKDVKDQSFAQIFVVVSLRLRVQNAVPAQPCVGKFRISLVLLNLLHCNFRLWFKTP